MTVSAKFLKAKPGDLFMQTVAQTKTGPVREEPKVLRFVEIIEQTFDLASKWKKPDMVKFEYVESGIPLIIHADDRYGLYPRLDSMKLSKMEQRKAQLLAELETINSVLNQYETFCK